MMLLEGVLAGWLLVVGITTGAWMMPGVGLLLLGIIWISTARVQMPLHDRLLRGPDPWAQRELVRTNWIRAIAWTLRGLVALAMVLS